MASLAFTAPHHRVAEIGLQQLKEGHNAVDAMVSAAAAIAVAYPHMNSIGGDGFWLLQAPGHAPMAVDACGYSAAALDMAAYQNLQTVPTRGPQACVTMGGTVGGWKTVRDISRRVGCRPAELTDLLSPAIELAKKGVPATDSLAEASQKLVSELASSPADSTAFQGFKTVFTDAGQALQARATVRNPDLAATLEQLAHAGLDDFYRGDVGAHLAKALAATGAPLSRQDFEQYNAREVKPLLIDNRWGQVFNLPAPTQGAASLLILALFERCYRRSMSEADTVHWLIEATKQAFSARDRFITDPDRMAIDAASLFNEASLQGMTLAMGERAADWPHPGQLGDTVWMGCVDSSGLMVSFIQSIYWEFGSAVVPEGTGIVWNNRGCSFNLRRGHLNCLAPGVKPLHTLNPALAIGSRGQRMVYGTMGGDGQPQTQAAIYTRHMYQQEPLETAIARGRWLLGRTWGDANNDLKMEPDLYQAIGPALEKRGHVIRIVPEHSEIMGHAGAIAWQPDGTISCATDPRSDGKALIA